MPFVTLLHIEKHQANREQVPFEIESRVDKLPERSLMQYLMKQVKATNFFDSIKPANQLMPMEWTHV
jgi:hypothetical protein